MKHFDKAEVIRTDLATFLIQLSLRLKVGAMALEGLARREGVPGDPGYDEITGVGESLERVADRLAGVSRRLCASCRMAEVTERTEMAPVAYPVRTYRLPRKRLHAGEPEDTGWALLPVREPVSA